MRGWHYRAPGTPQSAPLGACPPLQLTTRDRSGNGSDPTPMGMGMPEMQTQTQPSRRVQAVKPNPWDGHKHPAPNPWDGCGAVHLTQSQPTRPRPSQSPLQCSLTCRSGLPGTERFISPALLHFLWHSNNRTVRTVLFSYRLSCRAVPRGTGPALGAAYFLLRTKAKDERLGLLPRGQSNHVLPAHVLAERHARIRAVWLLVGGVEAHLIRTHSEDPSIQRIAKDSKHNTFDRI